MVVILRNTNSVSLDKLILCAFENAFAFAITSSSKLSVIFASMPFYLYDKYKNFIRVISIIYSPSVTPPEITNFITAVAEVVKTVIFPLGTIYKSPAKL